ncbi:MAG: ABC transporter ATP-binding protein [Methylotetracoccus sp.]|jgi:ABC-type polysaccharide/polyol phosphate transport system ATPase subunit|nr:ABC transporter ATP-binding protein [Methylotetracoccus sp.]
MSASLRHGCNDLIRRLVRRPAPTQLRTDEFWALEDVSATVVRGECLGLIGPNGAGKSTLLKLVNRELRADRGRIRTVGRIKGLIRLGSGLLPLYTGRENIYVKCAEIGLTKRETDVRLDDIIAFTDLHDALDRPVKHYSEGMYARLEFGIATCVAMDILLIDEVLSVGDIAFQRRCLDRLNTLKAQGTAILFVSHSEITMRAAADRCLLLFDGKSLGTGSPDALLYKYYDAVGVLNRPLKPLGMIPPMPEDFDGRAVPTGLRALSAVPGNTLRAAPGDTADWVLEYRSHTVTSPPTLVIQFWNTADILVATLDSRRRDRFLNLREGHGEIAIHIPFLPLAPGLYRMAGGFANGEAFISYRRQLAMLLVTQTGYARYDGLTWIDAELSSR